jgi:hypothetical protein
MMEEKKVMKDNSSSISRKALEPSSPGSSRIGEGTRTKGGGMNWGWDGLGGEMD